MLPQPRKPPSQTWRTFLGNHLGSLASIDFFTVPTTTFRILFVFFIVRHDRRRLVHFNVTEHPSARWTAQQIVGAFPEDSAPESMARDPDGIYGEAFRRRVESIIQKRGDAIMASAGVRGLRPGRDRVSC